MMRLLRIGYWRGDQVEGWPDPNEFVDTSWDAAAKQNVADYPRRGFVARAHFGQVPVPTLW